MHTDAPRLFTACLPLLLLLACSSPSDRNLRIGHEPDGTGKGGGAGSGSSGGSHLGDGGVGVGNQALTARIEDIDHMTIEVITLACAGDCADVEVVAHGGNPPYVFAWEDGSSAAKRHVCLEASKTLSVSATDTAIAADEFKYKAQSVTTQLTATVLDCGGDSGAPIPCEADAAIIEELTPDIFGMPGYFNGGAPLPAGRYRVTYRDGCIKYDANWTWTVQGSSNFQFVLVGATTTDVLGVLPGTAAPVAFGVTGYAVYDDCVAANRALAPLDFDFAGGKLGIWQNDFKPEDNAAGADGSSPTWALSAGCP